MEEHPELAGEFSIKHTTAGSITAGCMVGRALASSRQMLL